MATPGLNQSPFVLPNMFDKPGDALQQGLVLQERRAERQYDINYRNQRLKEEDDWKKLHLIQQLTDLDKYQTGEQAADAIGFQKASDILSKYTALAGSMTPAELQYKINEDISKATLGMQTMKDELMQSDAQIKQLKNIYPSLNTEGLMKEHRREIIGRRVQGNDFVNPQIVEPSKFKLDDPDFVSHFVRGSEALTKAIRNPVFTEKGVTVAMGSPNSYTQMKGDLPSYKKLNYDPATDIKGGFLKKGVQPQMDLKSNTVKFRNKDVEVLDDDAYDALIGSPNSEVDLGLRQEAAQKYPDYYTMSNQEKEIVKREVAADRIKTLDQSGFGFAGATKPPHYSVNIGGSSSESNLNNIYERIKQKGLQRANDYKGGNYFDNSLLKSDLDADELEVVLKGTQNKDLTPDDVKVIVEDNGRIGVYNKGDGQRLVYLNQTGSNLPKQANVKGKQASVGLGNEKYKPVTADMPKPKKDPLKLFD